LFYFRVFFNLLFFIIYLAPFYQYIKKEKKKHFSEAFKKLLALFQGSC